MAYRRIDPRTKAAAIKAMTRAVTEGMTLSAAAHELADKYGLAPSTLQRYYIDTGLYTRTALPSSPVPGAVDTMTNQDDTPHASDASSPTVAAAPATVGGEIRTGRLDSVDVVAAGWFADTASARFIESLDTLSRDYVTRIQAAAVDELIARMQALRSQLRR